MNLSMQFIAVWGKVLFKNGDRIDCEITNDGTITVKLWYEFHHDPLILTATVSVGDDILLNIRPHRIELYVNGELCDEEWPCGKGYLTLESEAEGDFLPTLSELSPEVPADQPFYTRRGIETSEIRIPTSAIASHIPTKWIPMANIICSTSMTAITTPLSGTLAHTNGRTCPLPISKSGTSTPWRWALPRIGKALSAQVPSAKPQIVTSGTLGTPCGCATALPPV